MQNVDNDHMSIFYTVENQVTAMDPAANAVLLISRHQRKTLRGDR